jgi:O-antigen/teichoic acid export membrane protein
VTGETTSAASPGQSDAGSPPPSQLSTALLANYLGQGWIAVANLAFIPAYLAYLGTAGYGLVGAFTIVLACAMLLDAGLTLTINREMARFVAGARSLDRSWDLVRTTEWLCLGLVLVGTGIGLLCAPILARSWLADPAFEQRMLEQVFALMSLAAVLRVVEGVFRGALMGLGKQVMANLLVAFFTTVRMGGAALVLAWYSATVFAFMAWQALVLVASICALLAAVRHALPIPVRRPSPGRAAFEGSGSFAAGVVGTSLVTLALTQTDKVLLVRLLPLDTFAYYALASAVAVGLYQVVTPVQQALYPALSRLFAEGRADELARQYHFGAQIVAAPVAAIAAILVLFAEPILLIWTTDVVVAAETAPLLMLLTAGTALHCLMYMPYSLQLAAGWSQLALKVNIVATVLLLPAILLIVPRYGAVGAAATWLVLNCGYLLFTVQLMHRRLLPAEKLRWYGRDVARPVAVAFGTAASGWLVMPANGWSSIWATGAFIVAVAGLTLTAALLTVDSVRHKLLRGRMRAPGARGR